MEDKVKHMFSVHLRSWSVVTFLSRRGEGGACTLLGLSCTIILELHTSQNHGRIQFSLSLYIFISSNAQNRHGFVGLASLPILFYAYYKAVLRIKITSDDLLGVERNYGTNSGIL